MKIAVEIEGAQPVELFDRFVRDLAGSLRARGSSLSPGPEGGVDEGGVRVGDVVRWSPPEGFELRWHPGSAWGSETQSRLEVSFEKTETGTRVELVSDAPEALLQDSRYLLSDWVVDEVLAGFVERVSPRRFGEWLTDRMARRPSGEEAKSGYRDPTFHRPNFKLILSRLGLTKDDYLLEVGCGGGAFLSDALESGCRAVGVDHSPDMVAVATEVNSRAIEESRLRVGEAEAESLPFPDGTFTCAVSTGVFGLLRDPGAALAEVFRVLRPRGRLVLFTDSEELRGTAAAPEPIASHSRFFSDAELMDFAKRAGFPAARVERPDLGPYAREAGLPEELVRMFTGPGGGQLLCATK